MHIGTIRRQNRRPQPAAGRAQSALIERTRLSGDDSHSSGGDDDDDQGAAAQEEQGADGLALPEHGVSTHAHSRALPHSGANDFGHADVMVGREVEDAGTPARQTQRAQAGFGARAMSTRATPSAGNRRSFAAAARRGRPSQAGPKAGPASAGSQPLQRSASMMGRPSVSRASKRASRRRASEELPPIAPFHAPEA